MVSVRSLLAVAASAAFATAQTYTSCQPLNKTCPDDPALGTSWNTTFDASMKVFDPNMWHLEAGEKRISFDKNGAALNIGAVNETVTVVSNFYIFFGIFEIIFKAAPGAGVISTGILLSDDLDEIDWEVVGSNDKAVYNNYYGHGNRAQAFGNESALAGAATAFHNYTIDWTKDRINYMLDGNIVRTVGYAESGKYPQTPCQIKFGIWPGGDAASQGTVDWAGGRTDYSQGPFTMTVRSIRVVDGTQNATSYSYGDKSGTWQSIKIAQGQSDAYKIINKLSTTQSAMKSWGELSTGAKIGIAAGVGGGLALAMLGFCIWCCMQRKRGREEKRLADKEWDDHQNELLTYRRMQAKGQFGFGNTPVQQKSHMSFGNSNKF